MRAWCISRSNGGKRFETDGYLVVQDMLTRQRVVDLPRRLEELDASRDSLPESTRANGGQL